MNTASRHTPLQSSHQSTGLWAQDPQSAIWMGTQPNVHHPRSILVIRRQALVSCVLLALLVLGAVANVIDVYGAIGLWARAALPAVVIGACIAWMSVLPTLRIWWQLVALVVTQWIIGPVVCCPETTIAYVLPTLDTLRAGWLATLSSFKYVISIEPPIGQAQGSLMAVWTIGLWCTVLAGVCAVLPRRRYALISVIVVIGTFALCAALGTATGWYRVPIGIVSMMLLIMWLSWRWHTFEWNRWLSTTLIVLLAASIALSIGLAVHPHRAIVREYYDPPLSPYDYASPLSGMRAYIKQHQEDTVLTVRNLPAGTPVRLAVLDRFDGNVWNLSDGSDNQSSSHYMRVGSHIRNDAQGTAFHAQFTVHDGMRDDWLPLAGAATSISLQDKQLASSLYYNTATDAGILTTGVSNGLAYQETGVIPTVPTTQQIAKARIVHESQAQPKDVPDSITAFATAVAGGQANRGEGALALANALRERGWFSHGLASDYPSLAGHGNYRLNKLLAGTAMVGDSEQYASAMALMARELGMASRVVLGFIPKDDDGDITDRRTEPDGEGTIVQFTGNDIAAWVEIKLANYGWVPFYPTPQETKIPDDTQNLTPPNPQSLVRQPPVPLTDPLRDDEETGRQSALSGDEAEEPPTPTQWDRIRQVARRVALYGSPLWIFLALCVSILIGKAIQLAYVRSHGRPQTRIESAWRTTAQLAHDSGVHTHGTRREQSKQIAQQLNISIDDLNTIVHDADYASFSGERTTDEQAARTWKHANRVRHTILDSLPWLRRLRTRLSLRGVRRLHRDQSARNARRQR